MDEIRRQTVAARWTTAEKLLRAYIPRYNNILCGIDAPAIRVQTWRANTSAPEILFLGDIGATKKENI